MRFSDFNNNDFRSSGILSLMDDLGKALSADQPPIAMMGGGNPAHIQAVTTIFKKELQKIIDSPDIFAAMIGNYDLPKGNIEFIKSFTHFINRHYTFNITTENVAVTAGSQTGYYQLFNLLSSSNDKKKKILFPIVPDYIGYLDQLSDYSFIQSATPKILQIDDHSFKYQIDFDNLKITDETAAICLSRPTNPSGNVITNQEITQLADIATDHSIPLIIDNAYGIPFPSVIDENAKIIWDKNIILSFSLSKVGLPSSRTGIFIARTEIIEKMTALNAIIGLAPPSFGQYIIKDLLDNDQILTIANQLIKPYYQDRYDYAMRLINRYFPKNLPWRLHQWGGSYFLWLWLDQSSKNSQQMYQYLKQHQVIVVPGDKFFLGKMNSNWPHQFQCLRINFARPNKELDQGIPMLADSIRYAYNS